MTIHSFILRFFFLTFLCIFGTQTAFAQLPASGGRDENFKPEDHLLKQAKKDDKKAQLELALCYLIGKYAVEPDAEKALNWLQQAASQDKRSIRKELPAHPRALLYMGMCHENPMYAKFLEIEIDRKKALDFYLQAEHRGYKDAAQYIAKTYRALGRTKDASAYFKKAADLKIPSCQVEYAKQLLTGTFTKKDPKAAISYLNEAGIKGNGEAFLVLADIYSGKFDEIPQDFDKMIDALWQAASTRSDAMTRIGYCYQHGIGLPKDELLAYKWYKKAATNGKPDVNARIALATCYSKGIGVAPAPDKAFENYLIASAEPDAPAISYYNVALCYLEGKGVKSDTSQAFNFLSKATADNFAPAWVLLGQLYEQGQTYDKNDKPLPPSPEKAFTMYKKAADLNHMRGLIEVGRCYYKGLGVKQNKQEGLKILRNAAQLKSKTAVELLMEFNESILPGEENSPKKPSLNSAEPGKEKGKTPAHKPVDNDKPLMQF